MYKVYKLYRKKLGKEIELSLEKEERGKSDLVRIIKFHTNYIDFHTRVISVSKMYIMFWKEFNQDLPGTYQYLL